MAYSTESQVEGEFKNIDFTSTTAVTSDDITRFIAEADALIDAKVGLKYAVPITGAASLLIMRYCSIQIVADRVRKILEVKTGESDKDQDEKENEFKNAESIINRISKGELVLSDATLANSHDGIKDYVYANSIEPDFSVTSEQW